MAKPHGFDHFCTFLKGLEAHFVIIGGGAAAILMDDQGIEFRATKDVDLVIVTQSAELNARIVGYVNAGGYQTKEATEGQPRYYRFLKPTGKEYPAMIEIFARNELALELKTDQYIIPVSGDSANPLSAILLDDEYFELITRNLTKSASGIPLINPVANICLKARAHRELFDRRAKGDKTAEEKAIQKHLKDIWRLAVTLTGEEKSALKGFPANDVSSALTKLDAMTEEQFKQVTENTPGLKKADVMGTLRKVFP